MMRAAPIEGTTPSFYPKKYYINNDMDDLCRFFFFERIDGVSAWRLFNCSLSSIMLAPWKRNEVRTLLQRFLSARTIYIISSCPNAKATFRMLGKVREKKVAGSQSVEVSWEKPVQLLLSIFAPMLQCGSDTKLGRFLKMLRHDEFLVFVFDQFIQCSSNEAFSILCVRFHVAHDHLHSNIGGCLVPAIVIGRHADHLVSDFGFASEF